MKTAILTQKFYVEGLINGAAPISIEVSAINHKDAIIKAYDQFNSFTSSISLNITDDSTGVSHNNVKINDFDVEWVGAYTEDEL